MDSVIGMLIDCSSSMGGKERIVTEARNEFVRLQQMRIDDCLFIAGHFNNNLAIVDNMVSIFETHLWDSTRNPYHTSGGTNMCKSFDEIVQKIEKAIDDAAKKKEPLPTNVTLVLQSDGDTADVYYKDPAGYNGGKRQDWIKKEVERLKAKGWQLIYLADGQSAENTGKEIGFPTVIRYGGNQTAEVFDSVAMKILEAY